MVQFTRGQSFLLAGGDISQVNFFIGYKVDEDVDLVEP